MSWPPRLPRSARRFSSSSAQRGHSFKWVRRSPPPAPPAGPSRSSHAISCCTSEHRLDILTGPWGAGSLPQPLPQPAHRVKEVGLGGPDRASHHGGDFVELHLLEDSQNQGFPLPLRETPHRLPENLLPEESCRRSPADGVLGGGELFQGGLPLDGQLPPPVGGQIQDDARDPGPE